MNAATIATTSLARQRVEASAEVLELVQTIRLLLHGGAGSALIRAITGARLEVIKAQAEFEGIQFIDRGGRRYRDLAAVLSSVEAHIAASYFLASYQEYCKLYETMADWGAGVVTIKDADGSGTLVRGAFARALYSTLQVCPTPKFSSLQARMIALDWGEAKVQLVNCSHCPTRYLAPATPGTLLAEHGCPACRGLDASTKGRVAARVIKASVAKAAWAAKPARA